MSIAGSISQDVDNDKKVVPNRNRCVVPGNGDSARGWTGANEGWFAYIRLNFSTLSRNEVVGKRPASLVLYVGSSAMRRSSSRSCSILPQLIVANPKARTNRSTKSGRLCVTVRAMSVIAKPKEPELHSDAWARNRAPDQRTAGSIVHRQLCTGAVSIHT